MSGSAVGQVSVGTAKMIGVLLAICGNTLIACSLTLQKKAHNSLAATESTADSRQDQNAENNESQQLTPSDPDIEAQDLESSSSHVSEVSSQSDLQFLSNPTWWLGTFLMAAGEVGNFAAFAFAPASLVAPLGAWSVVLSAILAHIFLQEHVSNANLLGIALCVIGAFLIGAAGPDVSAAEASLDADAVTRLLLRTPFVIFILLTLTATVGLMYISHHTTLGEKYIFVHVGVSSLLGGVTVVCAKALSTFLRLTIEGNSQFGNFLPFLLVVILALAILAQLRYLNMAMAQFGNAQVIPVYYVLFTTCAMTSGVIMYREFDALTLRNIPFFLGICSTMSGVFLVSKSAKDHVKGAAKAKVAAEAVKNEVGRAYAPLPISPISSPRGSSQPVWP
ncbi:putative magnesium transporter NIPA5 [Gracilariopsis chorda]|uniref:Putative magnesium transporter NIPA5 n=1 Tax=Gracilariopsis chorda TaxID=448386 RepID=A0A2V3J2T0_9FLOR|nr:putative magnesium transporter NIPA5 [Gracilariopsis chorda]|eukprot:PXF48684.1 putative magnesium transporter NIPA5 [Gracilariopsis chorda]